MFNSLKNKIFILLFLAILTFPWVGGGVLRLVAPDTYSQVSVVETEKRKMQKIEWKNLLNTGESVSGFVDDRIPFRFTLISMYKSLNDRLDGGYQKVATAIGSKLYVAKEVKPAPAPVVKEKVVEKAPEKVEEEVETEEPVDANYFPLHTYQDVIIARDGWLFLYGENEIECYQGTNILSDDEVNHYVNQVNQLKNICDANGKQLYIYIAPNKSSVYTKYMPTVEIESDYRRIQRLYERMQNDANAPFLYPLMEELQGANEHQVYYKYDTHWNHLGALYGVNALYASMGVEQTDPNQWITGTQDAEKYELYTYMGIPDSMVTHDDIECTVDYRPEIQVDGLNLNKMVCRTTSNGANEKKLCLIGDSFRVNMMPYMSKDFTKCTFAHRDYMGNIHADIQSADIIVIEAVERYDYEAFHTIQKVINVLSE